MYMRLRQLLTTFATVAALSFTGLVATASAQTVQIGVKKVSDGDTITGFTEQGTKVKVRLYGIDAPEVGHPNKPGQTGGEEARIALHNKIAGKPVTIEVKSADRYKRIVAIVRLGSRDINREMVQDGHAWAYRQYLSRPYASIYLDAESAAREQRLGLWRQNNPQPPWQFRKAVKQGV